MVITDTTTDVTADTTSDSEPRTWRDWMDSLSVYLQPLAQLASIIGSVYTVIRLRALVQ